MSVLCFSEVSVSYAQREVVTPFTGSVESGEWIGLIGPNGAGKSSLLRAVAGLVPYRGDIAVDGRSLAAMSDRDRARLVAYVPQEPLIPGDMPAFDYVLLGRTPYVGYFGAPSRTDRAVVADVLDRLRLGEFADRMLGALSGGERQRIVLARALAQQAPILLLDEPTSALDIGHQQQALELITELRRSQHLTVISALHDLTLAGTYTDRLVMLHEGAVVAEGSPADVLTAERLGEVYHVCVTVDIDPDDGTVIVVPRRGFPVEGEVFSEPNRCD
jgi:iron complex transport system ATP-binding protein